MEDRHAISEPRLLSSTQPSWLVDITRDGVNEPVDTIEINETTLPPRKKKGKVVWRLPSDAERLPSFPADERRRIMELFKERKKQRKKKAMKESSSNNQSMDNLSQPSSSSKGNNAQIDKEGPNDGVNNDYDTNIQTDKEETTKDQNKKNEASEKVAPPIAIKSHIETASGRFQRKRKERKARAQSLESESQLSPKLEHYEESQERTQQTKIANVLEETISKLSKLEMAENAGEASRICTQIQNILDTLNSNLDGPSVDLHKQSSPQQTKIQPQHNVLPDAKFLIIPDYDRPPSAESSLAIVAAKTFVDFYYPHISHGLANELTLYYTSNAQKSVSVGGAHSVVGTREDIKLQLSSLAGSNFIVRGVVSQDTFEKGGAHILVTGNMQTTAGIMTPFAHSIDLVLMNGEFDFQIHNDALSLMTSSEEWNPRPTPPPPGVSRPPGLNF